MDILIDLFSRQTLRLFIDEVIPSREYFVGKCQPIVGLLVDLFQILGQIVGIFYENCSPIMDLLVDLFLRRTVGLFIGEVLVQILGQIVSIL